VPVPLWSGVCFNSHGRSARDCIRCQCLCLCRHAPFAAAVVEDRCPSLTLYGVASMMLFAWRCGLAQHKHPTANVELRHLSSMPHSAQSANSKTDDSKVASDSFRVSRPERQNTSLSQGQERISRRSGLAAHRLMTLFRALHVRLHFDQ
jgi:hypothetical protein